MYADWQHPRKSEVKSHSNRKSQFSQNWVNPLSAEEARTDARLKVSAGLLNFATGFG
jgi:hypothetical protein